MIREASRRFGLSPAELARRVLAGSLLPKRPPPPLFVLECSATQAQDLAQQVREKFDVHATPWVLSRPDPLPDGELVATLFHVNELRQRFPEKFPSIHFLSIRLDPGLHRRLQSAATGDDSLRIHDHDPAMARNIAADLTGLLTRDGAGPTWKLGDGGDLGPGESLVHVISPRLWGSLPDALRQRRDVVEARYVFDSRELLDLGARLGWPPAFVLELSSGRSRP